MRRFNIIRRHLDINDIEPYCKNEEYYGLLDVLMQLPQKYKIVILLHYVEGYKVDEIAKLLNITSSAVKKRLQRGRELIGKKYQEEVK